MEDILRLYRDAPGAVYDGEMHGMDFDLGFDDARVVTEGRSTPDGDSESDIDGEVVFHGEDNNDEEEEEEGEEEGDLDWNSLPPTFPANPVTVHPCTTSDETGPRNSLPFDAPAYDFFSLFFPEEMFEMMATETNLYATQQQEAKGKEDKYWKEVSAADMKVFVAINVMMGIHVLPEYSHYWSRDDRLNVPGVATVMGKSRYEKICQYLHLNDSTKAIPRGEDGHDPLYKVRPVIDNFRMRASELYVPGTNLSIDEAMIAYTGRLHFKQYIKAKPTPWGIKVWCIADPRNGYMLDIDVYTGKTSAPMPHGVGHHVVMGIGEKFLDKYHHFYFDNYFASVKLANDLLARRTYCCSTIRSGRRGWPQAFNNANTKKMAAGEIRMQTKGPLLATVWNDKRKVSILSTNSTPSIDTVQRRVKGGVHTVAIPTSVLLYNTHMFSVDLADQLRSYYAVGRSGVKWWRYVFWFIIHLSFVNSWNLFRAAQRPYPSNARQISHLKFRLDVCTALVAGNVSKGKRKVQLGVASAGNGSSLSSDHQQGRLVGRKAACYWCSRSGQKTNSGRTSETVFGCTLCKVRLHKGLCFASFHRELGLAQE